MRAAPQWVDVPGALRLDRATLPEVAPTDPHVAYRRMARALQNWSVYSYKSDSQC